MIKSRILTAIAVVLSLLIVYGGWLLTNQLLDRQHLNLMNTVHSISVNEPSEAGQRAETAKVNLSIQEISNILNVWSSGQTKHYHDPYDGQLSMEEAIKAANSGLSYFCNSNILPKELLASDLTQTSAFLYDVRAPRAALTEVNTGLAYSFWSVSMSNREIFINLTINAQTGQIWMTDISTYSQGVNFNGIKALDMMEQYEAYLGLNGGGELRSDEAYAFKSYDNQIGVTVYKKVGESGHYESLHFSLTSTR